MLVQASEGKLMEAVPNTLEPLVCSSGGEGRDSAVERGLFPPENPRCCLGSHHPSLWFLLDRGAVGRAGSAVGSGCLEECFLPEQPGSFRNSAVQELEM